MQARPARAHPRPSRQTALFGRVRRGPEPYEYVEDDHRTLNHHHEWDDCSVEIDRDAGTVTAADGEFTKTAAYNGSQGCTLCPDGEGDVHFEPVEATPALDDPTDSEWPTGDRNAVDRRPDGVDAEALSATLDRATRTDPPQGMPPDTRALVVLRGGRIVGERYASGFNRRTRHVSWSMGKSVTAALIGVLVREGHFEVDDPAPIDDWMGRTIPGATSRSSTSSG